MYHEQTKRNREAERKLAEIVTNMAIGNVPQADVPRNTYEQLLSSALFNMRSNLKTIKAQEEMATALFAAHQLGQLNKR